MISPIGAHVWGNRTVEQPLTVLWAAKHLYPEEFKDLNLEREVMSFYATIFGYPLSLEQAQDILSGTL